MKAVSLTQPYATALFKIMENGKRVKTIETRSWTTKFRGRLAVRWMPRLVIDADAALDCGIVEGAILAPFALSTVAQAFDHFLDAVELRFGL